jgi:hypothetical protein
VTNAKLTTAPRPSVGPLLWWHAGREGWPQLVVPYVPGSPQDAGLRHTVYVVSSGTGQVQHIGADFRDLRTLDLDGDGLPDLLAFRPDKPGAFDQGGKLEAIRGRSPEVWRRKGGSWQLAGDLTGDGVPCLVTAHPRYDRPQGTRERERDPSSRDSLESKKKPRSEAISALDGKVLWQREINDNQRHPPWQETMYARLQPLGLRPASGRAERILGDLDGDGAADLLVTSDTAFEQPNKFSPLLAVSGRTGKPLWEADIAVKTWRGHRLLECRDLDGDGKPEVLFVSAMDWGWDRSADGTRSSNEWQYWLAVLSGRDGKVKWKQPLCQRGHRHGGPARTPFACVLADLDGDGVQDVIIENGLPDKPAAEGLVRAFSGADGALLWKWTPQPRKEDRGWSVDKRPTLAVGDLDGDGRPAVVVLHTVTVNKGRNHLAEVVALDGRTGRPKWSWREPVDSQYNESGNVVHSRVTPLLVNLGGKRAVCVWTHEHRTPGQIVLLDAKGKELRRERVAFRLNGEYWKHSRKLPQSNFPAWFGSLFHVWAVDMDGDGADELVYFTSEHLRVTSGRLNRVRWEWPLPEEDCDLLQVRPATASMPAILVVRAGSRVVFLADDPKKPLWTCSGPGKPFAVAWMDGKPPHVLYELDNETTACRLAQADPQGWPGEPPPVSGDEDPRFVVSLPWYPIADVGPLLPHQPLALVATLLGVAVAVLILPAVAVVWCVRRRAWLLGLPLVWLGLCWGGAWLLFRARLEEEALWQIYNLGEWGFAWRIGRGLVLVALAGLPAVAFVAAALLWLRRGQWRKLVALLVGSAVLAALVGSVWLLWFADRPLPEQRYSWRGWYSIWPAGGYAAGAVILGAVVVVRAIRLGGAGWGWLRRPKRGNERSS